MPFAGLWNQFDDNKRIKIQPVVSTYLLLALIQEG